MRAASSTFDACRREPAPPGSDDSCSRIHRPGADIAVTDAVDHLHQIADRPVFTEKPNLICAATLSPSVTATSRMLSPKRHTLKMTGILSGDRLGASSRRCAGGLFILPVAGHHAVLLAHPGADEAELAAAMRGLVQVHKVHIDAVPGQRGNCTAYGTVAAVLLRMVRPLIHILPARRCAARPPTRRICHRS